MGLDLARGKLVKEAIMKAARFKPPANSTEETWRVYIMEKNKYSLAHMKASMGLKMRANGGRLCAHSI